MIVIPTIVRGKNVTGIGDRTFKNKNIESVKLRDHITYIGEESFMNSGLSVITIPKSVTEIGARAFLGCPLSRIIMLGNRTTLTVIGDDAFGEGDNSFREAFFAEEEHDGMGEYAYREDIGWYWDEVAWPYEWTEDDFTWETRSNVTVEYLDERGDVNYDEVAYITAFANTMKTSYNIPYKIDGKQTIMISNATHPTRDVLKKVTFHPYSLVKNGVVSNDTRIANNLIGLHRIGMYTANTGPFDNFKQLTDVYSLPEYVTNMFSTFQGCSNLVNGPTVIPDKVTEMPYTFNGCSSLVNGPTVIPDKVTNMRSTFNGCSSLRKEIFIESTKVSQASYCFSGTSLPKTIYVPDGSTTYTTFNSQYGQGQNGVKLLNTSEY